MSAPMKMFRIVERLWPARCALDCFQLLNLKLEGSVLFARWASLRLMITLQDRFNPSIMAGGAKVVDWLYSLSGLVNMASSGGFPKLVSGKLFLFAFKLDHLVAKISYHLTKRYIRFARTDYLLTQCRDGFSDVIHWRRLRRLKHRLESVNNAYSRIERRGPMLCDVDCLLRGIYVEIHQIAVQSKENSEFRKQSGVVLSEKQVAPECGVRK